MAIKDGVCEYCGQAVFDGSECSCALAQEEQARLRIIGVAKEELNTLLVKDGERHGFSVSVLELNFLQRGIELIANGVIKSFSCNLGDRLNVAIASTDKGDINIKRDFKLSDKVNIPN